MPFPTTSEQKELDARIVELEREVVALKRLRNGFSYVSRVPPEILCELLLLATTVSLNRDTPPLDIQFRGKDCMKVLCHVCHAWRTIALTCPQLWAAVDVRTTSKPEQVDFFVSHARPLPMSFCLKEVLQSSVRPELEVSQETGYDNVKRVLSESGGNFTKLVLIGNFQFITECLSICPASTQMRSLEVVNAAMDLPDLDWWSDSDSERIRVPNCSLVNCKAPNLGALNFIGCDIPLKSPLLFSPNLTHITLGVPPESTASQLFGVMRSTPRLQRLELAFRGELLSSNPLEAVHLPYLTELALISKSAAPVYDFLDGVSLTATTVNITIVCSVQATMTPRYIGGRLYRAIGKSRRASVQCWLDLNQPFSPSILCVGTWGEKSSSQGGTGHCIEAKYLGPRALEDSPNDPWYSSITSVDIELFDEMSAVDDREWHPLFIAPGPGDLAQNAGWAPDAIQVLNLVAMEDDWPPPSFWTLISQLPNLQLLIMRIPHLFRLLPSIHVLCVDHQGEHRGFPFPRLHTIEVRGAWPCDTTPEDLLVRLVAVMDDRLKLALEVGAEGTGALENLVLTEPLDRPASFFGSIPAPLIKRIVWTKKLESVTDGVEISGE
ncbi:hypothetical protein NMY22_g7734 [Coprinellus aureogranulatus]|nr:hypothetical protein NMY22_g7734 [Coprinellus aureogranulatus]